MAAGTPIVASDIHGYKGVLRRGREGLLVPPREPKELAGAIARLLRDDELRAEMGLAGAARAQEFSWERVTAKVDDFYSLVIRRLAARNELPEGFSAPIPPSSRGALVAASGGVGVVAPAAGGVAVGGELSGAGAGVSDPAG
jgi:hypothetical protein